MFDGNSCGLTKSITSKSFEIKDMYNNINNISSELFKIVSEINRLSSYVSTIDSTKADISSSIESTKKQISDEEYVLNLITDVLDHNMTESQINNAVNDRFGIGNIENQLCNEACQLLWAYLNSGGEFYLNEWFTIKERLQERIAEQSKV